MSKADTLLKKATYFERLALYSDRRSFLQTIAQSGASDTWGSPLPENIKEGLNSLLKDLAATKPDSSVPLQNKLMSFYQGMNTDMGQLAQAIREAANTIPGDHTTQVQNALSLASKVDQLAQQGQAQPQSQSEQVMTMPADRITAYPPIDKGQQEALSRFITMERIGVPLHRIDGKLGPETRGALETFKKWYNAKATGKKITSDNEALQLVKFIVDNDPKKYGK